MSESANDLVLVVARTRPDGMSTRGEVTRSAAPDRVALAAVVAADAALHAVRRGETVEVTVAEDVARPVEVLAMMRSVGDRAPEESLAWPDEIAEKWENFGEQDRCREAGFEQVDRWVSINDQRAAGVMCGPPSRLRLHLVLLDVDADPEDPYVVPLSTIADSWYQDDGMSRVSGGDGSKSLVLVAPSVVLMTAQGDAGGSTGVLPWPATMRGRAALVARWIEQEQLEVAAALSMATLATSGLRTSDVERWKNLLDSVGTGCGVEGDDEFVDAVRRALDQPGSGYRLVRRALAAPGGQQGQALLACLQAVVNGERPLVNLLYGSWTTPASGAVKREGSYDTTWPHYARYMAELRARGVR